MAQYRLLSDIVAEIRRRADRPSTLRPTDADLNAMALESARALYDQLWKADNARFLKQSDIAVVSGTRSYSLPSDCLTVIGVAVRDTSATDGYRSVDRMSFQERYDQTYLTDKQLAKYDIRNSKVWFHPTPNWTETVRVEFIPHFAWAKSDGYNAIDAVNGLDEWITLDVVAKIKMLDEEDAGPFLALRRDCERRILGNAQVDIGQPRCVVDVRRRRRWWF